MFINNIITDVKQALWIEEPCYFPDRKGRDETINSKAISTLFQLGVASAANIGAIAYKLYNHNFIFLGIGQIATLISTIVHPLIPAFAALATGVLVAILAIRFFTGEWMGLDIGESFAQASLVSVLGLAYPTIFIHEAGHYLASLALFKDAAPTLLVLPFQGGETSFVISRGLTCLGELLGKENCMLAVTAAGMAASTLFATIESVVTFLIHEQFPKIAECIDDHSLTQRLQEFIYGLSTFFANRSQLSHDFMRLWRTGGIHPLVPMALMGFAATLPAALESEPSPINNFNEHFF